MRTKGLRHSIIARPDKTTIKAHETGRTALERPGLDDSPSHQQGPGPASVISPSAVEGQLQDRVARLRRGLYNAKLSPLSDSAMQEINRGITGASRIR